MSPDAAKMIFGAMLSGNGTAYFDALKIEIDGGPYTQGPDMLGRPPTGEEMDWVLRNSVQFSDAAPLRAARPLPTQDDFADLEPVKKLIGDAHLIGIGESTHGTHEFFQMKHRMLEFLVSEMGVTVFAMEAGMPEAYRINDYVLTGKGDPVALLKGMRFWTWNTQEVLDMILWMRAYNASGAGPVQFTGFDLQYADLAMDNVRAFVTKADPAYLSQLSTIYTQVAAAQNVSGTWGPAAMATVLSATAAAHQAVQYLDGNRAQYSKTFAAADMEWAVQNARIVEGATYGRTGDPNFRDSAMAANAEWILRQAPAGSKIMLWAHDGHIRKSALSMGAYLAAAHGSDYLATAQLFHEGQYNARIDSGALPVTLNTADPSEPGSVEYVLHSCAQRLILDLRLASSSEPASEWLLEGVQIRSIGAFAPGAFVSAWNIAEQYDAVIFFDHGTGSMLLP
jgi:erythromycin esterase